MPKISKTICAALLVVLNYANATYTNLLYGANSEVYFVLYGTSQLASATDRFITYYEGGSGLYQYLFVIHKDPACSLTITLPSTTTVRTVLFSGRDSYLFPGHIVSVGDTEADKLDPNKRCTWTNNTGATSTSSTTGLSAWLTCNNLVGSKLFVTNPTKEHVMIFEIMAFTQFNVMPFVYTITGATSTVRSTILKLKNTEMNIQTGTASTCYTSVIASASACTGTMNDPCYPYAWFMFEAVIPFSAILAIPQIP
jgi:hypothetical protein